MVMKVEPVVKAIESARRAGNDRGLTTGRQVSHETAVELSGGKIVRRYKDRIGIRGHGGSAGIISLRAADTGHDDYRRGREAVPDA